MIKFLLPPVVYDVCIYICSIYIFFMYIFFAEIDVEHQDGEGEESKSGDEADSKTEEEISESNGQYMSGFHFLTEEEAETADITDVSVMKHGGCFSGGASPWLQYRQHQLMKWKWFTELPVGDELDLNSLKHVYFSGGVASPWLQCGIPQE